MVQQGAAMEQAVNTISGFRAASGNPGVVFPVLQLPEGREDKHRNPSLGEGRAFAAPLPPLYTVRTAERGTGRGQTHLIYEDGAGIMDLRSVQSAREELLAWVKEVDFPGLAIPCCHKSCAARRQLTSRHAPTQLVIAA